MGGINLRARATAIAATALVAILATGARAEAGYDVTLVDGTLTYVSDGNHGSGYDAGLIAHREWDGLPALPPPRQWEVYPATGIDPDLLDGDPEDENCTPFASNLGSAAAVRCRHVDAIDVTGSAAAERLVLWSEFADRDYASSADLAGGNDSVSINENLNGPHDWDGGPGTDFMELPQGFDWNVDLGSNSVSGGLPVSISGFENASLDGFFGESNNVVLNGSDGDNELETNAATQTINGRGGNDSLSANAGESTMHGGFGNDDLDAAFFSDPGMEQYLYGEEGNDDVFSYGEDITIVEGGPGNDNVTGWSAGVNTARGGADDDFVWVSSQVGGFAEGGTGTDQVWGGAGGDTLDGGPGSNERISGFGGADTITVEPAATSTNLVGDYSEPSSEPNDDPGADTITGSNGTDSVNGGALADAITTGPGIDTIKGDNLTTDPSWDPPGNDTIDAGAGNDFVFAGPGDDEITGGPGDDYIDCGGQAGDEVIDREPGDTLINCGESKLDVSLETSGLNDNDDLFTLTMTLTNNGTEDVTGITPHNGNSIGFVQGVFPAADQGDVVPFQDSGQPFPQTLAGGDSFTRSFSFLTLDEGKVLIQSEVIGVDSNDDPIRDAEYAEVDITPAADRNSRIFQVMGAMENFFTDANSQLMSASRNWASQRVKDLKSLPAKARRAWLGKDGKFNVTNIHVGMARLLGISPEELAAQVPAGKVVVKGGAEKIAAAKKAVRKADTPKEVAKAKALLAKIKDASILQPDESLRLYNEARMESDNAELWRIYEDYAEGPAKALWQEGGSTFRWMAQIGSYEGRQQLEADLAYFAELNNLSTEESGWIWAHPVQAYDLATGQFRDNVEAAEASRAQRENFRRGLYVSDPEKAIELDARNDSRYAADWLRGMLDLFAPSQGELALEWGGKLAVKGASRASVLMTKAIAAGKARIPAGAPMPLQGVEDLGGGGQFVDNFIFPSADPAELIKLNDLGKKGGAGMRDQRIAEQINREVTAQLKAEFPEADPSFTMAYRPKKDYEPIGSLAKPQAFSEKNLDPRSVQVLGAPSQGLGSLTFFPPEHPSSFPGWKQLSALEKEADLKLYEQHLEAWTNFHKRTPEGKTAEWKKAIGKDHTIEFGGGHTVEMRLKKTPLGDNGAFQIEAERLVVDGTVIHDGKPLPIGSDLDPLVAIDSNTGKKLTGEIERRGLELWNAKSVKAQRELGFRSGGHGATLHGDDLTPQQWVKFARYGAVHLNEVEQPLFEALVGAHAGMAPGTKFLPAGLPVNEHVVQTTLSDTWHGPLGDILD